MPLELPEKFDAASAPSQLSAPAVVIVHPDEPNPPAKLIEPVDIPFKLSGSAPLESILSAMSVSPPVAAKVTVPAVAALAKVSSFTAEATVSRIISSLPLASAMKPRSANRGAVRVLFESVSVPARVAKSLSVNAVLN